MCFNQPSHFYPVTASLRPLAAKCQANPWPSSRFPLFISVGPVTNHNLSRGQQAGVASSRHFACPKRCLASPPQQRAFHATSPCSLPCLAAQVPLNFSVTTVRPRSTQLPPNTQKAHIRSAALTPLSAPFHTGFELLFLTFPPVPFALPSASPIRFVKVP
ncbi:hypothetical protein TRVL_01298 [Trypanosoma vivax]|nr:hypothetical protein TRVL_01298 [Trypanosoma vivax]